jgi:membrane protein required for colicin V production
MNYLDIILAIPLLWGLYKGVSKGIIKELASLVALIVGIYGAVHFADSIQGQLEKI